VDLNRRCDAECWATVRVESTFDRHGNDVAVVVAKMAYAVSPQGKVTVDFRPVRWSDVLSSRGGIKYPGDLCDEKPGTDVALIGTAHPPRGKSVDRFYVGLTVSNDTTVLLRKTVQVFGKRTYLSDKRGVVPGPSAIAGPTPLVYALCWGGRTESTDPALFAEEPQNPFGRGFAREPSTLVGTDAHVLEPVTEPSVTVHPSHGCFAPVPADVEPRRTLAGTYDAEWARKRAPIKPRDFDPLHNAWATPGLHASKPLFGTETFEISGVLPEGPWRFTLPDYAPLFESRSIGPGWTRHTTHLDGVLIDADARVAELTWRAAIPLPKPWELLSRIRVWSEKPLPRDLTDSSAATARTSQSAPSP
jgi:hypothetical protein